jgi:hypothetical protein
MSGAPGVYRGHCKRCEYSRSVFASNRHGRNFTGAVTAIRPCSNPNAEHTKVCSGCDLILRRSHAALAQLCAIALDEPASSARTTEWTEPVSSANSRLSELNEIDTANASQSAQSPQSARRSTRKRKAIDRDKLPTVERVVEPTLPFIDLTHNTLQSPQSPRTPKRVKRRTPAIPHMSPKTPASRRRPWSIHPPLDIQMRRFKHLLEESTEYSFAMMDVLGDGDCFFHSVLDSTRSSKIHD